MSDQSSSSLVPLSSSTGALWFDRAGQPLSLERFAELRADRAYRQVARTTVSGFEVITVWFGVDQGVVHLCDQEQPPLVFGTIVRRLAGGFLADTEEFSATETEANACHDRRVASLER